MASVLNQYLAFGLLAITSEPLELRL